MELSMEPLTNLYSLFSFAGFKEQLLRIASVVNEKGKRSTDTSPRLSFINGQRNSMLLLYKRYAFAKNNCHGSTTYWNCRYRRRGMPACNARLSTKKLSDGTFRVDLKQPQHNHSPSNRIERRLMRDP